MHFRRGGLAVKQLFGYVAVSKKNLLTTHYIVLVSHQLLDVYLQNARIPGVTGGWFNW